MAEYVVSVDAMGGDNAPGEIIKGCLMAVEQMPDVRILLTIDSSGRESAPGRDLTAGLGVARESRADAFGRVSFSEQLRAHRPPRMPASELHA